MTLGLEMFNCGIKSKLLLLLLLSSSSLLLLLLLLRLSFHSVAIVLTLVQKQQIRINIHKRINTKNTAQTIQNTVNTSTHITKTPTHHKIHTTTHYKTS